MTATLLRDTLPTLRPLPQASTCLVRLSSVPAMSCAGRSSSHLHL